MTKPLDDDIVAGGIPAEETGFLFPVVIACGGCGKLSDDIYKIYSHQALDRCCESADTLVCDGSRLTVENGHVQAIPKEAILPKQELWRELARERR